MCSWNLTRLLSPLRLIRRSSGMLVWVLRAIRLIMPIMRSLSIAVVQKHGSHLLFQGVGVRVWDMGRILCVERRI